MTKLLPIAVLLAVAIGAVVWALMPVQPDSSPPTRAAAPSVEAPEEADESDEADEAPGVRPAAGSAARAVPGRVVPKRRAPPGAVDDPPRGLPARRVQPAPPAQGVAEARAEAGAAQVFEKPPVFSTPKVKGTVRTYYGNLPKSGQVPSRIDADEVLPADVLATLGIPGRSRLTHLGSYPITDPEAFKEALALPEDQPYHLGFTVVTPDGRTIREYLMLEP